MSYKEKETKEKKNIKSNVKKNIPLEIIKVIFKIIELIITLVVVFFAIIIVTQRVTNNKESFLGYRIFRVETGSMIPKYLVGDVILAKEKDIDKIKIGDDLVYVSNRGQMQGKVITHQLIRTEEKDGETVYRTKGLANNSEDPAISKDQIIGVVDRKIYTISLFFKLLYSTYALYFILVLPLTIYIFFRVIHSTRRKRE